MLTVLLVIAAAAWVGAGNHALLIDFKRERQINPGWRPGQRSVCGEETIGWSGSLIVASIAGPLAYLITRADTASRSRFLEGRESLPGQLETEKRLLDDLRGVRRCLAIQAEKIAAAKALSDGTADPGQAHTAPLYVSDLESACDLWRELKEKESALEGSLAATREQIAWLRGMYEGIIEANQISEAELQEAVKLLEASKTEEPPAEVLQLPAPPDDDAAMLAKLGDPGAQICQRLLTHKCEFPHNIRACNGCCWGKVDSVSLILLDVLPFLTEEQFRFKRGEFGSWLMTEYGDHRLGMAVGQSATPGEAAKYIEWRLQQAMDALDQGRTATPAALPTAETTSGRHLNYGVDEPGLTRLERHRRGLT